ncbi:MAG: HD domain-containing protein [Aquificota bacterium]|nr:HD domain-containing protein [Aquificaceae bacterium]MDM7267526.1 HD domain-containing protein [Aquificaceae bacterium]QWK13349.1 MAG: HD domain-containing protein [Aquificota bacterium]HAV39969.1 phosphohydrolase [Aquificaceae bacterium]HCO39062.1 phosphohydrolase [Aquificaceae bacterium]
MFKEFSDPIHQLIKADQCETKVINSFPIQRLRFIKQLGITYLVFPSAQHSRFEHSLGTMELAGRLFKSLDLKDERLYSLFRLAGLLHDVGHTPFSHTTEVLLGDKSHENIGERVIFEEGVADILKDCGYTDEEINIIVRIAFKKDKSFPKIITGEFGADRMDYLRRDAYFCGTSYGFFDYSRLLENILLIDGKKCVHISALRSLESFILGRYFMYSQVYFHKVVRILNIHLKEVIEDFFKEGLLDPRDFHRKTDNHVISLMLDRHEEERVRRILGREHYREVFFTSSKEVFEYVKDRLLEKYEEDLLRFDHISKKVLDEDIPLWDGSKLKSLREVSHLVSSLRDIEFYRIYAHPKHKDDVKSYVRKVYG